MKKVFGLDSISIRITRTIQFVYGTLPFVDSF